MDEETKYQVMVDDLLQAANHLQEASSRIRRTAISLRDTDLHSRPEAPKVPQRPAAGAQNEQVQELLQGLQKLLGAMKAQPQTQGMFQGLGPLQDALGRYGSGDGGGGGAR